MGLALEIFGLAALVALAVAVATVWLARRLLPANGERRAALPAALASGFFAGYLMLPRDWAALAPQDAWQWLPYLGLATAIASVARLRAWLHWPLLVGLAALAGYLLTPNWPILGFSRPLSIGIATGYLLLIAIPLELLPARLFAPISIGLLALAAAFSAVAIGAGYSLRLAQVAAIAAGGLTGCWLAGFIGPKPAEPSIRGLIPVFAVLVGGIAFDAGVEPDPPLTSLLVLPMTPLALWFGILCPPRQEVCVASDST